MQQWQTKPLQDKPWFVSEEPSNYARMKIRREAQDARL